MDNENNKNVQTEEYSLNDDRRVKTLSPGAMVTKRFLRNKVAVTGLIILAFMFIFSFIGGAISPYREDEVFYRTDIQSKLFASVAENTEFRFIVNENGEGFSPINQAAFTLAVIEGRDSFEKGGDSFTIVDEGDEIYAIFKNGVADPVAVATYDIVSSATGNEKLPFEMQYLILKTIGSDEPQFEYQGKTYKVDEEGNVQLGNDVVAYASRYSIQALMPDIFLSQQFKNELLESIENGDKDFYFTENGETAEYTIEYDAPTKSYKIKQGMDTVVFDSFSAPSKEHLLGTDRNGMDMLTRLMYGGRVSLYIGFIVVAIETVLGVIMGGISGYFGGWVDNLIMRIVDVFYCIPSMPLIIILGAAMDEMRVDPQIRMIYLMLILGFLGWPGIARMIRGLILSLREQEFMTATEATGLSVKRRIFRHLIPNVIPQLIVTMTMSLGSTILMEATLSFLGLGVKFPFASWGNIISDVNDTYVLTNYWFIWIPAGFCLLLTVLAFNLVGDGLRDAFDPRMKR